jgi:uncharacterized membrane protein (DUF4010 family)
VAGLLLAFARHSPDHATEERTPLANPLSLRVAFTFAAIYAAVTLLLAATRDAFGDAGVLAVSGAAALVGADAPGLSLARLAADGQLPLDTAALAVVAVAIGTTLGKVGIVLAVGRDRFAHRTAATLLAVAAVGAAALVWRIQFGQ